MHHCSRVRRARTALSLSLFTIAILTAFAIALSTSVTAGAASGAPTTFAIGDDVTAPEVEIMAPLDGQQVSDGTPSLVFTVADENPGFSECSTNGAAFVPCSSPFDLGALNEVDEHLIVLRHTDGAGNLASTTVQFTVDTHAPVVEITAPTNGEVVFSDAPIIQFDDVGEELLDIYCAIDGVLIDPCDSPLATSDLEDGAHSFEVTYMDAAENFSTGIINFTVDVNGPESAASSQCTDLEKNVSASLRTRVASARRASSLPIAVTADNFVIAKFSVMAGSRLIATETRSIEEGSRLIFLDVKRQAKRTPVSLSVELLTFEGLASFDDPLEMGDTSDCEDAATPSQITLGSNTGSGLRVDSKRMKLTAEASQFSLATFVVVQRGKALARKAILLDPDEPLDTQLTWSRGRKPVKGAATLKVTTESVDGDVVETSKQLLVK